MKRVQDWHLEGVGPGQPIATELGQDFRKILFLFSCDCKGVIWKSKIPSTFIAKYRPSRKESLERWSLRYLLTQVIRGKHALAEFSQSTREWQDRTLEFLMGQREWGSASCNFRWRRNSAEDKLGRKPEILYQSVLSIY